MSSNIVEGSQEVQMDERVHLLQEKDMQRWLEQARAMGKRMKSGPNAQNLLTLHPSQTLVARERLIEEACALGDQLYLRAVQSEGMAVWIGPTLISREDEWAPRLVGIDWYDGIAGIAFFLGYLGMMTSEQKYDDFATLAIQSIRFKMEQYAHQKLDAVALMGLRSAIYLFTHLGALWNDESLLHEAETLVEQLPALIVQDKQLDVMSGTSGVITSLLGLNALLPSARVREVALFGGEYILSQARQMERGWGWDTMVGSPPLTGFSHGAAGIAYSLLWLASVSGDPRFYAMALKGLEYERSLFSTEQKNWPDLRQMEQSEKPGATFRHFWCHGAPGIGLARLASLPYLNDELIHEEIEAALQTTLANGFGRNHSLCHGDFGNLETLLVASAGAGIAGCEQVRGADG